MNPENEPTPRTSIPKEKIHIVALTREYRIEGITHRIPNARLSDLMNRVDLPFLPVTDAIVYNLDGREIMKAGFLSLNKSHVVVITTLDADQNNPPSQDMPAPPQPQE